MPRRSGDAVTAFRANTAARCGRRRQADLIGRFVRVGSAIGPADENDLVHNHFVDMTIESRAQLQLAAVHAAIPRWRWEYHVLPDDLGELKLREIANDPYTNQPFVYTRIDDRNYTLASAGPMLRVPQTAARTR